MKKWILFLSAILICSTAVHAQEETANAAASAVAPSQCAVPAEAQALQQIAQKWKDAYNSGDAALVASLYAENADYITQHFITGIVHGRAAIRAYVQRGVDAHYHIDSILITTTGCSDDIAYAVDRYQATNAGQKAFGVNLVVIRKIKGKWLIVAHEAAVPDTTSAVRHLDIPARH